MEAHTGEKLVDARPTQPPENTFYLWRMFLQIGRTRDIFEGSMGAIKYSEVVAWSTLNGISLNATEVDAIMRLDETFRLASMRSRRT